MLYHHLAINGQRLLQSFVYDVCPTYSGENVDLMSSLGPPYVIYEIP